jgi:hypothetical protein
MGVVVMDTVEQATLRKKIEELALSEEIKGSFRSPRSFWEHPLTLLAAGFIFTGIIGTLFSWRIQAHDSERTEETRHYQSSTKSVVDFSNALYLRYVRAGMVKSALSRGATADEIRYRKQLYDDALVQQESSVMGSILLIREAVKKQDYDDWEVQYDRRLKPLLRNLDDSLTKATDSYLQQLKIGNRQPTVDLSQTNYDYKDVINCEYALVNGIFLTLSTKQYVTDDAKRTIATQEEALEEVQNRCQSSRTQPQVP